MTIVNLQKCTKAQNRNTFCVLFGGQGVVELKFHRFINVGKNANLERTDVGRRAPNSGSRESNESDVDMRRPRM